MEFEFGDRPFLCDIKIDDDVVAYMDERGGDFRISTSCSGPVLMSADVKPPKSSDIPVKSGNHIIYISRYQLDWISEITMRMVPRYFFSPDEYAL